MKRGQNAVEVMPPVGARVSAMILDYGEDATVLSICPTCKAVRVRLDRPVTGNQVEHILAAENVRLCAGVQKIDRSAPAATV